MPPVPRNYDGGVVVGGDEGGEDEVVLAGSATALAEDSTTADDLVSLSTTPANSPPHSPAKKKISPGEEQPPNHMYKVREPLAICIRTLVVGIMACLVVQSQTSLLNSPSHTFWFGILLINTAVDKSSKAIGTFLQYVFPLVYAFGYMSMYKSQYPSIQQTILCLPVTVLLIGIPMSICLHRYFAHQAFATSRFVQAVLGFTACLAYQNGPLWWSAKHVKHHHHCDNPQDPHSVVQQGFYYAWFGWTMNPNNLKQGDNSGQGGNDDDTKYNYPPHLQCWELQFLDRYPLLPVACLLTLVDTYSGTPTYGAYNVLLPMLLCRLITLLFNVEFHPVHEPGRCKSIDDDRIMAMLVGENEHDVHHKRPQLSKRTNYDIPYWLTLSWMEPLGLVWNCR